MCAQAAGLSESDAASGVRAALQRGAEAAVGLLGRPDGFLGNPLVRIALPGALKGAAKLLRALRQGKQVDELVTAMNRGLYRTIAEEEKKLRADPVATGSVILKKVFGR